MFQKFALAVLLGLASVQGAFAEEFCVGERVVTDTHYRGSITAVYPDGTADVSFDAGGANNWPTSRLSTIPTAINGFYVNEKVVTDNHYRGTIVEAYPDGTVDIIFDAGGNNNWPTSRISTIPTSINGFSLNDRVVTDNHYAGTIVACYLDGTVDVSFDDGGTNNWPTSRISKVQRCIGGGSCHR